MQNEVAKSGEASNPRPERPFYLSDLIFESLYSYYKWGSFMVEPVDGKRVYDRIYGGTFIAPVGSYELYYPHSNRTTYLGVPTEPRDQLEVDLLVTFTAGGAKLMTLFRYKKHILPALRGALC